ncbi:hypothetical protein D8T45_23995 [Vibrio vulnificus]|nr:hypothetical protein D8T45_23995 [Vibrio vulnificus]RZR06909.1 hypothetical protein D8T24_23850 [Vibrio vulnificus]
MDATQTDHSKNIFGLLVSADYRKSVDVVKHIYINFLTKTFSELLNMANAALSGEQRQPPNRNHCTLNT